MTMTEDRIIAQMCPVLLFLAIALDCGALQWDERLFVSNPEDRNLTAISFPPEFLEKPILMTRHGSV